MAPRVIDRDLGMKRILRELNDLGGAFVVVGVQQGSARAEGELDNVTLMAIHEFGVPEIGIPERSVLRAAFDANVRKYGQFMSDSCDRIVAGTSTPARELGLLGELVKADAVRRIDDQIPPPLKQATIDRKGSSTPLIHTSQLKNSIVPKVKL